MLARILEKASSLPQQQPPPGDWDFFLCHGRASLLLLLLLFNSPLASSDMSTSPGKQKRYQLFSLTCLGVCTCDHAESELGEHVLAIKKILEENDKTVWCEAAVPGNEQAALQAIARSRNVLLFLSGDPALSSTAIATLDTSGTPFLPSSFSAIVSSETF